MPIVLLSTQALLLTLLAPHRLVVVGGGGVGKVSVHAALFALSAVLVVVAVRLAALAALMTASVRCKLHKHTLTHRFCTVGIDHPIDSKSLYR